MTKSKNDQAEGSANPEQPKAAARKKKFPAAHTVDPVDPDLAARVAAMKEAGLTEEEKADIARLVSGDKSSLVAEAAQGALETGKSDQGAKENGQSAGPAAAPVDDELLQRIIAAWDFPTENVQPSQSQTSMVDMHTAILRVHGILDPAGELYDQVMKHLATFYNSMRKEQAKAQEKGSAKPKAMTNAPLFRGPREKINKAFGLWKSGTINTTYQLPQRAQILAATVVNKECAFNAELTGKLVQMKRWDLLFPIEPTKATVPAATITVATGNQLPGPEGVVKGKDANKPATVLALPGAPTADGLGEDYSAHKAMVALAIEALQNKNTTLTAELSAIRSELNDAAKRTEVAKLSQQLTVQDDRIDQLAGKASTLKRMLGTLDSEFADKTRSLEDKQAEVEKRVGRLETRGAGPRASAPPSRGCNNGYCDDMQVDSKDEGADAKDQATRKREISPAEDLPRKRKSESIAEDEDEDASKKMRAS